MSPAENVNGSELTARIHSIETGGAVDGPGIRYIVFFKVSFSSIIVLYLFI